MNDERQRLPGQFTSMEVVAAGKITEDPKHVDLWSITSPKNRALTSIEQQGHFDPSINATQATRDSSQEPEPKSLPIDQIGITVPEQVTAWDPEIRTCNRSDAQRLRATLATGALLAALGLGWIGGSSSHHFFGPNPVAASLKQNSPARILDSRNETLCGILETGRKAAPGGTNTRQVATPTANRLGRGQELSQGAAQLATASTNPISSIARQNTTSPGPAAVTVQHRVKSLPRPTPMPETRPTTIEGWTLRDVIGGTVVSGRARRHLEGGTRRHGAGSGKGRTLLCAGAVVG